MSKYKVGDRVVVISEEKVKELTKADPIFWPDMEPFCGKTVVIREVCKGEAYRINGNGKFWPEEFFEGLEKDIVVKAKDLVYGSTTFGSHIPEAYAALVKHYTFYPSHKFISALKGVNNTMNRKDILAVRNYNDRAMVMQFDKKDKNGKNIQTRAEVHDDDVFDLDNGIRICLLKYLLGGHKEYMTIMDAARKSYKKTVKEDQKKAAEKYEKALAPVKEATKKMEEKEKRDKEIEELIAKAIKKALAETGENDDKSVEK